MALKSSLDAFAFALSNEVSCASADCILIATVEKFSGAFFRQAGPMPHRRRWRAA
jgi:hypothetical protein